MLITLTIPIISLEYFSVTFLWILFTNSVFHFYRSTSSMTFFCGKNIHIFLHQYGVRHLIYSWHFYRLVTLLRESVLSLFIFQVSWTWFTYIFNCFSIAKTIFVFYYSVLGFALLRFLIPKLFPIFNLYLCGGFCSSVLSFAITGWRSDAMSTRLLLRVPSNIFTHTYKIYLVYLLGNAVPSIFNRCARHSSIKQ